MLEAGRIRSQYDPMRSIPPFDPVLLAPSHSLLACHPVNAGTGVDWYQNELIRPLTAALGSFDTRTDVRIAGDFADAHWVAASGHLAGRFCAPLFGIPPTGKAAFLRFGRFDRLLPGATAGAPGSIVETILLLDLPALMQDAGCWPLGAPLGPSPVAPGPRRHDGVDPPMDAATGEQSLRLVEAMISGLMRYDGENLRRPRSAVFVAMLPTKRGTRGRFCAPFRTESAATIAAGSVMAASLLRPGGQASTRRTVVATVSVCQQQAGASRCG